MPTEAQFGQALTGRLTNSGINTYTFKAGAGGEVTLRLDYDKSAHPYNSLRVKLTDASGREVLNKVADNDKTWHTVIQEAGTYTLAISNGGRYIDSKGLAYTVDADYWTDPGVTYERPLHNTAATAMSIVAGRPIVSALQANELDFFKISTQQSGQLHLNFAHPDGPGRDGAPMRIQILESATSKVIAQHELRGSQLINADIEGGSYLLRVVGDTTSDRGIYSFIASTSNKNGSDFVNGTSANNLFKSSAGNDTFSGNGGFDTVQYDRKAADYKLAFSDAGIMVEAQVGTGGRDALFNIGRIKFTDKTIDLGDMTDAAMLYRLYDAALDRAPDEAGLGFWLNALDNGMSMHQVVHGFVDSAEFAANYSKSLNHTQLVTGFYQNILNRAPDAAGLNFWVGALDRGVDVAAVLEGFSESAEHQAILVGQISHGVSYIPYGA